MKNKSEDRQKNKLGSVPALLLKVFLTAAAIAAIVILGSLAGLLLISEDIHLPFVYIGCYALPALLLPLIWLKKRKKLMSGWLVLALVYFAALGVDFGMVRHDRAITINTSCYIDIYENVFDYQPFEEDSKIVKTDSQSLELTDDLPKVDGATALLPVYSAFVNAVYPDTVSLYDGTFENTCDSAYEYLSRWGYTYLAENKTDIFFDLYPSGYAEVYAEPYGVSFDYTTIGTEALVFFVHKDNPIDDLTIEQIRGIYSGEITNWSELGGRNGRIDAFQCYTDSGSQKTMERFMGEIPLMAAPTEKVYDYLYAPVEQVSAYKNKSSAIGFSFRYCVADEPDIKILSVEGAAPTQENIKNGTYPIVTPIYAVSCEGNTNENVGRLLDWILSDEGQYIIEQSGYTGIISKPSD